MIRSGCSWFHFMKQSFRSTVCKKFQSSRQESVQNFVFNQMSVYRHYSQQLSVKHKLKSRKKPINIPYENPGKAGFWSTIAASTAEEYNLEAIYQFMMTYPTYSVSSNFNEASNLVHIVSKSKFGNEDREIFIFREGSIVAWNVSDVEMEKISDLLKRFEINPYDRDIVKEETEVMSYTYSVNSNLSILQNGNIYLSPEKEINMFHRYTFSNGIALSVKLGIWEELLEKYIDSMEQVTLDLKLGNRIKLDRKHLLKKTGELFSLKHSINLSSELLDIPDFYWEREELENMYLKTCRYFNIPKRTQVINEKLNHCIELVDLLSTHLSDKHHTRLEVMIIALIMVEVGFEILHYIR